MQMIMQNMTGKIVMITGANSGIGKVTAHALADMGASVVMVARNETRGESARTEIVDQTGNLEVDLMIADLSSMKEVRQLASDFNKMYRRLDVLVNNAGAIFSKRYTTAESFEPTFAVNHLAPFLLTHDLLGILKRSAPSRIVNVSSGAHSYGRIDFDNFQNKHKFGSMRSYASTKLMNIMFTYKLARRLKGTGVTANVLHPGFVRTNFGKSEGGIGWRLFFKMIGLFAKSPEKGAETSIYLASSPEVEGISGKYFNNCQPTKSSSLSYDIELQKEVWLRTEELLGISYESLISIGEKV
jgi:retinol dehydrogenase-14